MFRWGLNNKKREIQTRVRLCLVVLSLLFFAHLTLFAVEKGLQIQVQPAPLSLSEKLSQQRANPTPIINTFNSTLFKPNKEKQTKSRFKWLYSPDLTEKRQKITGSRKSAFESYWKIDLDGFLHEDHLDYTALMRAKLQAKILTQLTSVLFAKAEFELLTSTGSVQKIYQRLGEINGISQREILFLWRATNWLTVQFGSINQRFLAAPLLLANIPFPAVVSNIEILKENHHRISWSTQLAVPTTFSDEHSIYAQSLAKIPRLFTKSLFWNYNPKSFYKIQFNTHFFHYAPRHPELKHLDLPRDIVIDSQLNGNTVVGADKQPFFQYSYTGFYFGLEPTFQIAPRLGLQLTAHYIINTSGIEKENLNQGELFGVRIPFDITESIRITPSIEYFTNQPDASVSYYNSERYGHSNRTGFVSEVVFDFYDRNLSTGFRYHYSQPVRRGLRQQQSYYLVFLRTNYAKI